MYSEASLHTQPSSAEEALKLAASFEQSREHYDKSLYVESARRVVFKNCMDKCELDNESVPNFNKNFYYNMPEARACLQSCYNFRMQAHLGPMAAKTDGLQFDFDQLKMEYQNYERWHPAYSRSDKYEAGMKETDVQNMVQRLREKTQNESGKRFDF